MNIKKLLDSRMDMTNSDDVHSFEEFKLVPLKERVRHVWYWPFGPWYMTPYALPHTFNHRSKELSDWDKCYEFLRTEFPVQVYLREDLPKSSFVYFFKFKIWDLKDLYYKYVIRTFKSFNKELVKVIPRNEWRDKVTIMPDFLFACVIDFVEVEKCFEHNDYTEHNKDFGDMLMIVYDFAKHGRKELSKKVDDALSVAHDKTGELTYEERYGDMDKLEVELAVMEKRYMTWIVNNVDNFWV